LVRKIGLQGFVGRSDFVERICHSLEVPNEKRRPKKLVPLPVRAARMLKRLKNVHGLSDSEKSVHALGLAATPQERWDMWEKSMRAHGYWKPLKKKKSGT
jgi:hypothetical protein